MSKRQEADNQQLESMRHSAAHVLAMAVLKLFPSAKLGIGPTIENGFYYDFDLPRPLTPKDLPLVEKEMKKIIKAKVKFEKMDFPAAEAEKLFEEQPYKLELIDELAKDPKSKGQVSVYKSGDFVDLCQGPHVKDTSEIGAFKLTSIAGAYWKGSEKNPMLTRIYGVAFKTQKELNEHLKMQEEAKKRDHRKLGKELDLFSFHDEGPGFPFWHPKGVIIYNEITKFWRREHKKRGYVEVKTPIILNKNLWVKSGHWDHYRDAMYFLKIDENDYAIKPMNCPGGVLIYKTRVHSYRDLPLEVGELGLVHRHELSGVLHGLFRVRSFTQDDAHIYCTPDQAVEEIVEVLDLVEAIYGAFGLRGYHIELSTRPEKFMGSEDLWEKATEFLKRALAIRKLPYKINPGEGAFYGPKIDFHIKDSLGRTWQCGTVQLDFAIPEALDLEYVGEDGKPHRPVMIHRTILGALERFIGILIEHYGGAFPVWLSPVQAVVIPVSDKFVGYANRVVEAFARPGLARVEVDERDETMQAKIRDAQLQKMPYMLVVGEREEGKGKKGKLYVSVRLRDGKDLGIMELPKFIERIKEKIDTKALDL